MSNWLFFPFFFSPLNEDLSHRKQQWGTINKTAHATYIAWSRSLVSGSGSKQPVAGSHEDRSDFCGLYVECMSSASKKIMGNWLAGRRKDTIFHWQYFLLLIFLHILVELVMVEICWGWRLWWLRTTRDEVSLLLPLPNRSVNLKVTDHKTEGYH